MLLAIVIVYLGVAMWGRYDHMRKHAEIRVVDVQDSTTTAAGMSVGLLIDGVPALPPSPLQGPFPLWPLNVPLDDRLVDWSSWHLPTDVPGVRGVEFYPLGITDSSSPREVLRVREDEDWTLTLTWGSACLVEDQVVTCQADRTGATIGGHDVLPGDTIFRAAVNDRVRLRVTMTDEGYRAEWSSDDCLVGQSSVTCPMKTSAPRLPPLAAQLGAEP